MTTTVSFSIAKLLKEKEYNKLCNKLWHFNGSDCIVMPNKNSENFGFSAPTIAEVVMWLYEKHGIWIEVRKHTRNGLRCFSPYIDNRPVKEDVFFNDYDTPTEAYEADIEYVLTKLI